ncbi:hypothetical protein AB0C70_39585 [Streptomyces sp. NPDC048564]|uniref:hypothetical protein n=1 Tax=Streptomyces sp. NPDC048564 TaxID=3155760 RepID=UPI00343B31C1
MGTTITAFKLLRDCTEASRADSVGVRLDLSADQGTGRQSAGARTEDVTEVLQGLSGRLAAAADALSACEVREALRDLGADDGFPARLKEFLPVLGQSLFSGLLERPVDHAQLAEGTRLYLIGRFLTDWLPEHEDARADAVRLELSRKLLVASAQSRLFPEAQVELIKAAAVSDLYVVRSEWRGYATGEIAAVKNVMGGERLEQSRRTVRETERTDTEEVLESTQTEESTETRTTSELSHEVSSMLSASLEGKLESEVTGAFPGGTYRVGGSLSGSIGISVSERLATRAAQEAVTKAASRVDASTRRERVSRELQRDEDVTEYVLNNTDTGNRRGVYRWLDRVERFQVFRVPDRLQLEFQLPNPAEFYKYRMRKAASAEASEGAPPPWNVTLESGQDGKDTIVDQADADRLGALFHATQLPPMPQPTVTLLDTKALEAKNVPAKKEADQILSPVAAGELEMIIPDGYEAVEVSYFMSGSPVRANWVREKGNNQNDKAGWDNTDAHVFHSIVLESFVGGHSEYKNDWIEENQGLDELLTTQGNGPWVSPGFGAAYARSTGPRTIKFVDPQATPPYDRPVRVRLKLGFRGVGAGHMQVGVQVVCRRTAESYAAWRQQVFEALLAAWIRWDRDYRQRVQTSLIFGTGPTAERSPARNRQTVQEELKRQIISWLLEEIPFDGRPGMKPPRSSKESPWRDVDVTQMITDAPIIQFFEQVFDWPNMGWIFYPYYWADNEDWAELAAQESTDPEFERFLRSGSARVLVPVRETFDDAVNHWLVYKEPFLGKGLPLPDHDLYTSLATEIRNLTEAPRDGEPVGRAWDVRTGTTFLWLDASTAIPANAHTELGETETTEPLHPIEIEE